MTPYRLRTISPAVRSSVSSTDLEIEGRAADDLEHVGGRRLPLQRSRSSSQLVEQPRVLDGDHGLGGEILHQRDLLVGERPNLLAINRDNAEYRVFLAQWHLQRRTRSAEIDKSAALRIAGSVRLLRREIEVMDEALHRAKNGRARCRDRK